MRALVLSLALGWLAAADLAAVDLSGVYDDEGVILEMEGAREGERMSFRALLALEWDPARGAVLRGETTRFEIDQEEHRFHLVCQDEDKRVTWQGAWRRMAGYDFDAKRVKLLLRRPGEGGETFLFLLSNDGRENLLVVTIERVEPGRLGVTRKPVGTVFFVRTGPRGGLTRWGDDGRVVRAR